MHRRAEFGRFQNTEAVRRDLKTRSVRSALFMASGGASDILIRFTSLAILSRLLTPEDFGLVAMVTAITAVVDGFRDLGLSSATVQRRDITHEQVSNLFWINTVFGLVFAGVLAVASPYVAAFYDDARLVDLTLGLALVFPLNGVAVQHQALMSRQLRQGQLALVGLLANVASVMLAVGLALVHFGYWSLVWREILRASIVAGGVWLLCRWLPSWPQRHVGTRSLIRFGGELTVTGLFLGVIANVDRMLIGRFFGAAPVGLYRQAQQLLLAPVEQLSGPIIGVAQPALSALQAEPGRYRRYYESVVFFVTLITLPLGLFVAIYAEEVTILLLGAKWRDASVFVAIFGIAATLRPAIGTSAVVLVTCGRSTRFLALGMVHGVVLSLFLLLGVNWGPEGVAFAHVMTTVVLTLPKLYYSFEGTPATLQGFVAAVRSPALASVAMLGVLLVLKSTFDAPNAFLSIVIGALLAALTYVAVLWIQPSSQTEIRRLLADVKAAVRPTPAA